MSDCECDVTWRANGDCLKPGTCLGYGIMCVLIGIMMIAASLTTAYYIYLENVRKTHPKVLCITFLTIAAVDRTVRGIMVLGEVKSLAAMDFVIYFGAFQLISAYSVVCYTWGKIAHTTNQPRIHTWKNGVKIFLAWNGIAWIGFIVMVSVLDGTRSKATNGIALMNGWLAVHVLLLCVWFVVYTRYFKKQAEVPAAPTVIAVIRRATAVGTILAVVMFIGILVISVMSFVTFADNGWVEALTRNIIFRIYELSTLVIMCFFLYNKRQKQDDKIGYGTSSTSPYDNSSIRLSASASEGLNASVTHTDSKNTSAYY